MKIKIIILLFLISGNSFSQEGVSTFGIQFKPIIPSNLFRAGDFNLTTDRQNLDFNISQKIGYSFGMIVRIGITKTWSFETGIKYTKRNFSYSLDNSDNNDSYKGDFTIVGYEIPMLALLNVQLDKKIFMNTAFGPSLDLFPSNVASYTEKFRQYSIRRNWAQLSLIANMGWEYRTTEKGTFYLGGSFHRPFKEIYATRITYVSTDYQEEPIGRLSGNYMTVDLRYFFHEDPVKKSKRVKTTK